MPEWNELVERVRSYNPDADFQLIEKAYQYAAQFHVGQKRRSGEPYIIHPLAVAMILTDLSVDDETLCAALMHDVLEDTPVTFEEMEEEFGKEITVLVDGVTKLKKIQYLSKQENQIENLRKMVMAMANDIRVIIIKLADRLHNMRTLEYMTEKKQVEKASETLEIYAPLAHRLGINTFKWELEDLSLRYLDRDAYDEIKNLLAKTRAEREAYIEKIINQLSQELTRIGVKADIQGRPKSIYSIYKKMFNQNKTFDQIMDLTAIRVIVDTKSDCYLIMGIVHALWRNIPNRFKDYISNPKANMYESLHTTVIGSDGEIFEVQIRTWEMHRTAEYGIAAHWKYKEGRSKNTNFDEKLTWVRQMMEWQQTAKDPKEFLEALKGDIFSDEVYVFSPKGDVVELPMDATPIDFAYKVHSQVGNTCVGAKVNGRIVPLSSTLKHGDKVEILTSTNSSGPSRDWLNIVKSSQAKHKIKQWFKKEQRDQNIIYGRDMLEKEVRKEGYRFHEILKQEWIEKVVERLNLPGVDDLYAAIGYGSIPLTQVVPKLKEYHKAYYKTDKAQTVIDPVRNARQSAKQSKGIIVHGVDDVSVKFARCCNPVPGDEIIGYITKGRGISVHRKDCTNIEHNTLPERLIAVQWNETPETTYPVEIQIAALDQPGYLAQITGEISKHGYNVYGLNATSNKDHTYTINIIIEVKDTSELDGLLMVIRALSGTIDVYRVKS